MKRNCLWIIAIVLACACAMGLLAACTTQEDEPLRPMSEVRIENDHVLVWDAVDGAILYAVRVYYDDYNGFEIPVQETSYALKLYEEGEYYLSVRPIFADGKGAYSPTLTYTISNEVVVTPSGDKDVVLRGAGTADNPLLIYTRDELASLTNGKRTEEVNGTTEKKQNYYRLMADIDLSGEEWKSIGSYSTPFEGFFDGNGHTIANLTQTKLNGESVKCNGLFGMLSNAIVVNLTLQDVNISLGVVTPKFHIGGLSGYSRNVTVENCRVQGSIVVDSPQSTQQPGYVGMLIGYSNGTAIRRCATDGTVNVTCALAFGGGICAMCTAPSLDSMDNCLSTVDVTAKGTGTSNGKAAAKAYAAGITYISNTAGTSNCVWLGKAHATVSVGTDLSNAPCGEGMFVCSINSTLALNAEKTLREYSVKLEDCYFDIDGIDYDAETYSAEFYNSALDRLTALANRYCVGCATSQKRTSTVGAVDAQTKTSTQYYPGLDWENEWIMGANGPELRDYKSEWFAVRFVADGQTVHTDYVLKGQAAITPEYVNGDGFTVQWDYEGTPIMQDTVVYAK